MSKPAPVPDSQRNLTRSTGRVLVVDDEPQALKMMAEILRMSGHEVETAANGLLAAQQLAERDYDAVLTDLAMPAMSGIDLLRLARTHDADLPVILITGAPTLETAIEALDYGACKYLVKPIDMKALEAAVLAAVRLRRMARIRRQAVELGSRSSDPKLRAALDSALRSLWIAYQPIVTASGSLYGYEALLRLREPVLPHPGAVIGAAEKLGEVHSLGRRVRELAGEPMKDAPRQGSLFVNLHPEDLLDDELLSSECPLTSMASRVVLEITERASLDGISDLRGRVSRLRKRGYRIAVDDLGAGYAGLATFAALEPDLVKIDMSLIRNLDQLPVKQRLVRSIVALSRDMGITVVGEGVETRAERDMLAALECDLMQGFLFAKPGEAFPDFVW